MVPDKGNRPVAYAGKETLIQAILEKYPPAPVVEEVANESQETSSGQKANAAASSKSGQKQGKKQGQQQKSQAAGKGRKVNAHSPIAAQNSTLGRSGKMTDLKKLYQSDLPNRAIAAYLYLRGRANKEGFCWPAVPTMARELKVSESTIRRALRDLVREGFLVIEERQRESVADSSNKYWMVFN